MKPLKDRLPWLAGQRFLGLLSVSAYVAIFKCAPGLLHMGNEAYEAWQVVFQIVPLLVAASLCLLAARRGGDGSRTAWKYFSAAIFLYLFGNLYYLCCFLDDYTPTFPNVPELAFFMMAIAFAVGMARYGEVPRRITRTNVFNFVLVYCSIAIACLFLLRRDIKHSSLSHFGTLEALLYPALWFSVAAFGVIAAVIYIQGRRAFPFKLLCVAVLLEASSDMVYAKELLAGTYSLQGSVPQLLWVTSIGFLIWAAVEHLLVGTNTPHGVALRVRRGFKNMTLSTLPGIAILISTVSASVSGAFGTDMFYTLITGAIGVVFAAVIGLREHSIIRSFQSLRAEADTGRRRLSEVLESTSDSVIVVDRDWRITYFNGAASRVLGGGHHMKIGSHLWADFPINRSFPGREKLEEAFAGRAAEVFEGQYGDSATWLGVHAFPKSGTMSLFFRDITQSRDDRLQLENLAYRDSLTGLANRALFYKTLRETLEGVGHIGLLILDLDHFKEINDTKGHPVGDRVLEIVAERLKACAGENMVARLGGDEFAVILEGYTESKATDLAEAIAAALTVPVHLDRTDLNIGTSIGITDGRQGADVDGLMRNADIALYEVKNSGRGGHLFFHEAMETLLIERNDMKHDLAKALENGEFELYYQPLVDFETGEVASCEALLRWNHPDRGLMPPDSFIPLIEESGLIVPIGAWVMRTACRQALSWPAGISVAVNVSTRQFFDPALLNTVKSILKDTGLPASRLELEITESALLDDSRDNLGTLSSIRDLGIRIALDDFGTGYSSLGYLHKFKFSKLKIDKSFIDGINANEETEAIVRSVISLGHSLGLSITAEGVETQAQYDWLHESCQLAQGHFISRPLPAESIRRFIARKPHFEASPRAPVLVN